MVVVGREVCRRLACAGEGETVQSMTASAVPPSESLSKWVSFELRYGTWASRVSLAARVKMTRPSVASDWLMAMLSCVARCTCMVHRRVHRLVHRTVVAILSCRQEFGFGFGCECGLVGGSARLPTQRAVTRILGAFRASQVD